MLREEISSLRKALEYNRNKAIRYSNAIHFIIDKYNLPYEGG